MYTFGYTLLLLVCCFLNLSAQTTIVNADELIRFTPTSFYYNATGELDIGEISQRYESVAFNSSNADSAYIFE